MTSPRFSLPVLGLLAALALAAPAEAASAPAWSLDSSATPSVASVADSARCAAGVGFCDHFVLSAEDVGAKPTNGSTITLADTLPAGLAPKGIDLRLVKPELGGYGEKNLAPADCEIVGLTCRFPGVVPPDGFLKMTVFYAVEAGAEGVLADSGSVQGGGAATVSAGSAVRIGDTPAPFGFSGLSTLLAEPNGVPAGQAGGHPWELHTRIDLADGYRVSPEGSSSFTTPEDSRDVANDLPVGLVGSALSAPTCTLTQLSASDPSTTDGVHCPPDTVVGFLRTEPVGAASVESPLYNIAPQRGVAAEFGYIDLIHGSHVLDASLAPTAAGYVVRVTSPEIPQVRLTNLIVDFYGDPAARDAGREPKPGDVPTFSSPARCDGEPTADFLHADTWQHPGRRLAGGEPDLSDPSWVGAGAQLPPVSGCEGLAGLFSPTITAHPETTQADKPTGLEVDIKVPQSQGYGTRATPPLKKAVVTLPEGMSVNPSSANGLEGCSLAQIGVSASGAPDPEPVHCPDASKIGTLELETPLLKGTLEGQIYVAKQSENPFGSLLAIYLVVDDPTTGVLVKIPGEVRADPQTGQLETVVDDNPQFPFSELRTHFFGGQRAALRTPAVCGSYKVTSELTPWSAPQSGPPATPSASFAINQGCAESAAEEPNSPSFQAGTESPLAGAFSPFVMKLHREDGSQELSGLSVALPKGLIARLAGVAECPESGLATARSREHEGGGREELASPSCPQASEVGSVTVGAGAGLTPYYTTGKAYLAGPYKGAPLSLAIITPAVAGPFDLGDVVVRAALQVDPYTAQVSAVSDPIPHIIDGIPLDVRSIALQMSRHEFTLNPTNCEAASITATATSVLGNAAGLTNRFQVGGCKALGFRPKLQISLAGSTRHAGHPALKAVLTYPKGGGYANIARAQVNLPHSEFIDQGNLNKTCTRPVLLEGACPASTVYGRVRAWTPLLEAPLEGNVYLVGGFGYKLPALVAELDGQIRVLLVGKVDSGKNHGIRNTFEAVPDAPVEKFELQMKGGPKYSLLENSEPLCAKPQKALADFVAQSGKVDQVKVPIKVSCHRKSKGRGKGKKGHSKGAGHGKGRSHKHGGSPSARLLDGLTGAW